MRSILLALLLLLSGPANAQLTISGVGKGGFGVAASGYSGPGNVVSGAISFWGLRAYSLTYASGLGKLANVCTPADAVCADVNSDSSGNFNLAGTGSLICNNSTSICTIKTLYDQSGALNCSSAACDLTQATVANRPVLTINCNGALPCWTSSGSAVLRTANATTVGAPFTIVTGAKRTAGTTYGAILASRLGSRGLFFGNIANRADVFSATDNLFVQTDNVWHAIMGIWNGASSAGVTDGTSTALTTTNGLVTADTLATLDDAGDPLTGTMVEIGLWPSAFSAGNISGMNSNVHAYWGF